MLPQNKKAPRNKTIDFIPGKEDEYLKRAVPSEEINEGDFPLDSVIMGDCLEIMGRLNKRTVDLMIVDPPYNIRKNFHGSRFEKKKADDYREYTVRWLEAALPLLSPEASVYVCCDWESSMVIGPLLSSYMTVRNRITWQREKGRGAASNWKNSMEDIWFATVGSHYYFDVEKVKQRRRVLAPYKVDGKPKDWVQTPEGGFRDTCPSNFWDDISVPYWSMPENTAHPTQKPEKLMAKLILASSREGDVVFDPFAGSGTTAVAAKKLGRRFAVIEQNPVYCAWALKRLEMAETDKRIQGYEDGVFWERNTGR